MQFYFWEELEMALRKSVGCAAVFILSISGAVKAQDFTYGQSLFERNCAVCHGVEGAGDGPVAELFSVKPKNLRSLASDNDGAYPFSEVYQAINRRKEVAGHGTTEMPVWGDLFETEMAGKAFHPGIDPEELVQARILALVYYLQSVQE